MIVAGSVEVNAHAHDALRQSTQCTWIEHLTYERRVVHYTTDLLPAQYLVA